MCFYNSHDCHDCQLLGSPAVVLSEMYCKEAGVHLELIALCRLVQLQAAFMIMLSAMLQMHGTLAVDVEAQEATYLADHFWPCVARLRPLTATDDCHHS